MQKMSSQLHVMINCAGRWSVRRSGAERASRNFTCREEAVDYAYRLIYKRGGSVFMHNLDGTVLSVYQYVGKTRRLRNESK